MTINYTTLLGLAQPVTGTEQGTWGDTVNTEITALLEDAIADAATFSVTSGDVTLTSTAGQANQARMAILLVTGTPGVSRNIIAPSQSKWYIVKNSSDASVVLKGSATTGVTILAGTEALCFWNGSDFEIVGVNGPSSSTDNAVVRFDGTTGKVIQNSGVIIDDSNNVSGMGTLGVGAITTTGVFTATAGTVSAPAITTTGDTNTGIFFPAADTIAFAEGGAEAMRIDSSGNVGIGTTSPGYRLEVNGGASDAMSLFNSTNAAGAHLRFAASGTVKSYIGGAPGFLSSGTVDDLGIRAVGSILFATAGSGVDMTLDSSGNVGIGTSSPVNYSTYKGLTVADTTGGFVHLRNTANSHQAELGLNGGTGAAYLATYTSTPIQFLTNNAERMRIDSSGYLLVGATSSVGTGASRLQIGSSGGTAQVLLKNSTGHAAMYSSGTESYWTTASGGFLAFGQAPADGSTFTERMRITSSGNVGIGTSSPGAKLSVQGDINCGIASASENFIHSFGGGGYKLSRFNVGNRFFARSGDGSDPDSILINDESGGFTTLKFFTSALERMRINSSGGVQFNAGISVGGTAPASEGSGVKFPATQVASTDANTLDDYEEGTWTPVLNFGGSAGVTTYAQQNGTYTKVGNTVTVRGYFSITTKSAATGNADLAGFPFATKSGTAQYHTAYIYMNSQSITGAPMCYIGPNATNAELGQTNGSSGFVTISNTNFLNGGDFIFQATYLTA